MPFKRLTDLELTGKRVLIRVDMNVPIKDGVLGDDTRIRASLPSIEHCLKAGASVIVMTHLGRPVEGELKEEDRIEPVAKRLGELLNLTVPVVADPKSQALKLHPGEVAMLQNVRCNPGEKGNSDELGQAYASLCDVFVHDAFGTAHRAEASTYAVAKFAPCVAAGILMTSELEALARALDKPQQPLVAIVGGAKVSTKLEILGTLADKVDQLIVGGGIANTFLLAAGYKVGKSLAEHDMVDAARAVMDKIKAHGGEIPLPVDVIVGKEFSESADATLKTLDQVVADDMILDIGPRSTARLSEIIAHAGTVVWNGPVGVFEIDQFSLGTRSLALAIASSPAFSITGGGDTLAAVTKYHIARRVSYISTGGGAFLEFLEGKRLPAVDILEQRAQD